MREYFYLENGINLIKIISKRKPGPKTKTKSGTWIVNEVFEGKWSIACFPEITLNQLNKLEYLCSRKKVL